jgi:hypothetical protein
MSKSEEIKAKLEQDGVRYWANDNIADYIKEGDKQQLIDEAVPAFENVLQYCKTYG